MRRLWASVALVFVTTTPLVIACSGSSTVDNGGGGGNTMVVNGMSCPSAIKASCEVKRFDSTGQLTNHTCEEQMYEDDITGRAVRDHNASTCTQNNSSDQMGIPGSGCPSSAILTGCFAAGSSAVVCIRSFVYSDDTGKKSDYDQACTQGAGTVISEY